MKKYYIIPVEDVMAKIFAESPKQAIEGFVWNMNDDMNLYFKAVTEDEYLAWKHEKDFEAHSRFVTDFMEDVARDDFDIPDEDARDVAEMAYEKYCDPDYPLTEYGAVELAAEEYWEDKEEEKEEEE